VKKYVSKEVWLELVKKVAEKYAAALEKKGEEKLARRARRVHFPLPRNIVLGWDVSSSRNVKYWVELKSS